MKFRFCGDGDCPDWVLAEIISTLSNFDSQTLESLTTFVAKRIVGENLEEDAIKSLCSTTSDEGKSAVACLHYLLNNAARHNVSGNVFNEEIQQLGLPKEHAEAVCRVLSTYMEHLRLKLIERSFKINELSHVKYLPTTPAETNSIDCAKFQLNIAAEIVNGLPENSTHTINIEGGNLKALLIELKTARSIMKSYEPNNKENNV